MPRLPIDQLVTLEEEDLDEAFAWIDWRSEEREVVEAFAERLDEGDVLAWREEGRDTVPVYRGVAHRVPLTGTGSDRYVMIFSLMEILKDTYAVFRRAPSDGDTHGFLVLSHDEARELAARHPKWMRRHLETMTPGIDGFSGVDVPWYGHETQAPGFAKARASVDAGVDRMKARSRAFTEAMREDGEAGRREQGVLAILGRQQARAGMFSVAAVGLALAQLAGVVPGDRPAGGVWAVVGGLALAAGYHAWVASRVRWGWRPAGWVQSASLWVAAAVVLGWQVV